MVLSAACGAWRGFDGKPAHSDCTGKVNLPAPDDVCGCECHQEIDDADKPYAKAEAMADAEYETLPEAVKRQYEI